MSQRPQDRPRPGTPALEDPTRDIRLPPRPDRPPPAMPRAWAGFTGEPVSDAASPDFSAPPPAAAPPPAVSPSPDTEQAPGTETAAPEQPARPPWGTPLVDQPTDELGKLGAQPRERTLAFSSPEMSQRPAGPVHVARTPRRWPWVLVALLPLLIIAGTGIALLLLFQGG